MKTIKTKITSDKSISIPGSKSVSHRMLICASMADGTSIVRNVLKSEDISHTTSALSKMGALIEEVQDKLTGDFFLRVTGFNGKPKPYENDIYLGNSGTSMRLLAGTAALGNTPYILTGDHRMQERPMGDLLEALNMAGAEAASKKGDGTPPVIIKGIDREKSAYVSKYLDDIKKEDNCNIKKQDSGNIKKILLDCSQSSQYLSSMLMMGAALPYDLLINLPGPTVSAPYVDLTIDVMKKFGVNAQRLDDRNYLVKGDQTYRSGSFAVEPDISNASYFWAAGAITGNLITVTDINQDSLQGDKRLLDILKLMGCEIDYSHNGIGVSGNYNLKNSDEKGSVIHSGKIANSENCLKAVDVDMSDIPDVVPTLAVVAAFAEGTTKIVNIEHLREKECDRISAVVSQLRKIGVEASEGKNWLSVTGVGENRDQINKVLHGAIIETFNDHRIAMAFSIAGLLVDGIEIENEGCVAKSFPNYWEKFESLGV
ncbi:MAG: 3-phosphoshikimate 1-carboxyvinyltransferase [Desulfamplus sp.]|nr:3-phosphoshikimate 1-carboxyvinyltransferase [Desulfamplus sp.]